MKYVLVIAILFISFSCKNKKTAVLKDVNVTQDIAQFYYTCSMHTQVMLNHPGKCPICGMQLVKVEKSTANNLNEVRLNEQQVQLGNIKVDTIRNGTMGNQLILTGTLNADQRKIQGVSSRVMGRVERLYFKNVGDFVHKGDKLYELYSEELNNAKQEYTLAIEKKKLIDNPLIDFSILVQSAKNKLMLWGLTEGQINGLSKKNESPTTTFYSPASGYITSLDVKEGEYSMEGGTIVKITDLSTLWVEAQVYSSQLSQINMNATATLQFPNLPGKESYGKIEFVNPEINPQTRITLLRIYVGNNDNQLKPGMPAYVIIKNKETSALTLPSDAVLRTASGATVWLQTSERTYISRMIEIGFEDGDKVQIKSGLKNGDIVVTRGAFLINSEFIFKQGSNPMEGMKM